MKKVIGYAALFFALFAAGVYLVTALEVSGAQERLEVKAANAQAGITPGHVIQFDGDQAIVDGVSIHGADQAAEIGRYYAELISDNGKYALDANREVAIKGFEEIRHAAVGVATNITIMIASISAAVIAFLLYKVFGGKREGGKG